MARDLRKRITLAIIIPLILGMLIITAVTCIPLYVEYSNYISNYDDHMINNEKQTMIQLSKVIANRESNGILSLSTSLLQLSTSLITYFYFGRIKTEPFINTEFIPFDTFSISSTQAFANSSEYPKDFLLDPFYINTTYFYYFIQPIIEIGQRNPGTITAAHLTFPNNFFAFFPADSILYSDFAYFTEVNSYNASMWWNSSIPYQNSYSTITFISNEYHMVCSPLSSKPSKIDVLPCIVFSLDYFAIEPSHYYNNKEMSYLVDQNLIIYQPISESTLDFCDILFNINCKTSPFNPYIDLRFNYPPSAPSNDRDLDKNIFKIIEALKSHKNHTNSVIEYSLAGHEHVMSISPLNISLPLYQSSTEYFSSVLTTEKEHLSRKFDKLSTNLTLTIILQISVFAAVSVLMIIVVFFVSYKITSSVIAPIDDLFNILKRLHMDLGVDVKSHQKKGPPEIINLYEVFDRLRLILRFEDAQLFEDPTYAMMNYAQALKLFNNFNNKRAMEICLQEIGHIHMKAERYLEASINYHYSCQIAEELILPIEEISVKKVNTARAMMKAHTKIERAKQLFEEALKYYHSKDTSERINFYMEYAECLLINNDTAEPQLVKIRKLINQIMENSDGYIWLQKLLYLEALQSFNNKNYRTSAEYCIESLENFPYVDRLTRKKSLKILQKIFKKFDKPLEHVESLQEFLEEGTKDIVVVIDSKIGADINEDLLQQFIEMIIGQNDRASFIQFDETIQIMCNLTKFPRKRCSTCTSLIDIRSVCVVYDAINEALSQINSVKSIVPQSFLSCAKPKKEWITVITNGEDFGSKITEVKLMGKLYESNTTLVVILITGSEEIVEKMKHFCRATKFGVVVVVPNFLEIDLKLLEAAAYISHTKDILV